MWNTFASTLWLLFEIFIFVAYLMVMFHIILDLFRDRELGGFAKALWFIALIFLPFITALVYIIARGRGMAERQNAFVRHVNERNADYIREMAGASPADQIARAKALLGDGTINQAEFDRLKAKALA